MSLHSVVAALYPAAPLADAGIGHLGQDGTGGPDMSILPLRRDGGVGITLPCHEQLLRARCASLPQLSDRMEVDEDLATVMALLRWVYCEAVDEDTLPLCGDSAMALGDCIGTRAVRLGKRWGLNDVGALQARVAARRQVSKARGSLKEDILRAYDAGHFSQGLRFRAMPAEWEVGAGEVEPERLLDAGWQELLERSSSYFGAMLGGAWAESKHDFGEAVIDVQWPQDQLERLLRFLHGAAFIENAEDVPMAIDCAKFFGVPSLFASVTGWMSSHLEVATAPSCWNMLIEDAAFWNPDARRETLDADDAFFEFHIQMFEQMSVPVGSDAAASLESLPEDAPDSEAVSAQDPDEPTDTETGPVPLHDLSIALLRRLLASGLVDSPTWRLKVVVKSFVNARCSGKGHAHIAEVYKSLFPPCVLFNRSTRSNMSVEGELSARDFAG